MPQRWLWLQCEAYINSPAWTRPPGAGTLRPRDAGGEFVTGCARRCDARRVSDLVRACRFSSPFRPRSELNLLMKALPVIFEGGRSGTRSRTRRLTAARRGRRIPEPHRPAGTGRSSSARSRRHSRFSDQSLCVRRRARCVAAAEIIIRGAIRASGRAAADKSEAAQRPIRRAAQGRHRRAHVVQTGQRVDRSAADTALAQPIDRPPEDAQSASSSPPPAPTGGPGRRPRGSRLQQDHQAAEARDLPVGDGLAKRQACRGRPLAPTSRHAVTRFATEEAAG